MHHSYWAPDGKVNLDKLREEARDRINCIGTYREQAAQETIIHMHLKPEPCADRPHELYSITGKVTLYVPHV